MKKILFTLVASFLLCGCGLKWNTAPENPEEYRTKAKEALAVAESVYITSKAVYEELYKSGDVEEEKHQQILLADKKLKAAYEVAKDSIEYQDQPTIKNALKTVLAMADTLVDEISDIADNRTIRNIRIVTIILSRMVLV